MEKTEYIRVRTYPDLVAKMKYWARKRGGTITEFLERALVAAITACEDEKARR
jgi:hypothetical protein